MTPFQPNIALLSRRLRTLVPRQISAVNTAMHQMPEGRFFASLQNSFTLTARLFEMQLQT